MPDNEKTPRRKFLSLGLPMLIGGGLAGCAPREEVRESSTESLRRTDPKLVLFEEMSEAKTGLAASRGLCAAPDGTLYVAGDHEILACDTSGKTLRSIALSGAPRAVAVASDGSLCVAMPDYIEIFDQNGARLATWAPPGENALFTAVAAGTIGGKPFVWAANSAGREVVGYDAQGRVTARIGRKDAAHGYSGLILPSPHLDVALARDGKLRLNNPGMHRVETHTTGGVFVSAWGTASSNVRDFCGCCNPTDFAILPDGRFVTAEKGIPRVKIYSATGQFEGFVAPPEAFAISTMGIDLASLPDGRIVILDPRHNSVRIFRRKGKTA